MKKNKIVKKNKRDFLKTKKTEVLDYFPRGGTREDFTYNLALVDKEKKDFSKNKFLTKKRNKSVDNLPKESEIDLEDKVADIDNMNKSSSRALLPKFRVGDLVLLTIAEIRKDYMIANYTRNKKAMIHSNYSGLLDKSENFSFENHFKVGQFVCGAVVSPGNDIQLNTGYMNKKILVSIDPKIINTGLNINHLVEGMDIYGKLTKEGDKFLVDFKFTDAEEELLKFNEKIFRKEHKSKYNFQDQEDDVSNNEFNESDKDDLEEDEEEDSHLEEEFNIENFTKQKKRKPDTLSSVEGLEVYLLDNDENPHIFLDKLINSYYFFKLVKIEKIAHTNRIILQVSLNHNKYKYPIKNCEFKYLRPGFLFKAIQTRELLNGVEVAFGGNIGSVFGDHIRAKKSSNKLITRIIHISVNNIAVSLSNLKHIVKLQVSEIMTKQQTTGKIYENLKVDKVLFGNSYQFLLEGNIDAFLHSSHTINRNEKIYLPGEFIEKARVKEYNFFDDKAILTTKKELLEESYVTWANLEIGNFVVGIIVEILSDSLIVNVNQFIQGKLSKEHITDYPLTKIPKKYKVGQSINVRVFSFDYSTKSITFTMKESLMDKEVQLTGDFNALSEGNDLNVVYIGNALFQHSGNIIGKLINYNKLKTKENFKIGKLYKYKVYKVDVTKKKLYLTNEMEIWQPGIGDWEHLIKRHSILSTISNLLNSLDTEEIQKRITSGNVYKFEILSSKRLVKLLLKYGLETASIQENIEILQKKFLVAKLVCTDCNLYGFIPTELISDFYPERISQIYIKLKTSEIKPLSMLVLYVNPNDKTIFLSSKLSLIQNKESIASFSNILPDHIYYGFVNKKLKNGLVIQFLDNDKTSIKIREYDVTTFNFAGLVPGQTLLTQCHIDLMSGKRKFNLKVYYPTLRSINEMKNECIQYNENHLNTLKEIISSDQSKNAIMNLKVNSEIEGKIGIIKEYGILISLKTSNMNVTGFIKNEHTKFSSDAYKIGETKIFKIIDIDIINGIAYLTDSFSNKNLSTQTDENTSDTFKFYNKYKETKGSHSFVIELFHDHYISASFAENSNVKAIVPCNLYNFNFETSSLSDIFKIGDLVTSNINNYDFDLDKLILEPPEKLLNKIMISSKTSKMLNNQSISPGNIVKGRINGVKGTHIFVYIDKTTLGRIHLNQFVGDLNIVKESLKSITVLTDNYHSMSRELSSNSLNYPEELKVKCKILHVENKNNMKMCDLTNALEEYENSGRTKLLMDKQISKELDLNGESENIGIISRIDISGKYPLKIDYGSGIDNKKATIHFSHLSVDQLLNLTSAYKIGDKISFYSRMIKDDIEHSLIPFSKISKNIQIDIDKIYPVRVLKSIPGRGLVVDLSIYNNHTEAFVDICEISDDLHPNPLNVYKTGNLTVGRVLKFNEKLNKYFISLRNSIIDEESYDLIKNGSTLKFNKKFDYFERVADFRNKIMKFGAGSVICPNLVAIGYITSSSEKGVFIKLASDVIVRASLRELTDEKTTKPFLLFKQDFLVLCRVISMYKQNNDNESTNINVSLRENVIKYNLTLRTKDLVLNNFYLCSLMNFNKEEKRFEIGIIGSTFTGLMKKKNIKDKTLNQLTAALEEKNNVILQLVKLDKNNHPPKLRFSNINCDNVDMSIVINSISKEEEKNSLFTKLYENVQLINNNYKQDEISLELKELEKNTDKIDYESLLINNDNREKNEDEPNEDNEEIEDELDNDNEEIEALDDSIDDLNDEYILDHEVKSQFLKGLGIKVTENKAEEFDENEMKVEQVENVIEHSQNIKSSKKREKEHLKEELLIREKEEATTQPANQQSVEYYEKQILANPNNSLYWIQYAAYILDQLNLNSARKIFERAIATINITLLKEKLNIWIAYMNLENSYGTQESFKNVVERGLEINDKKTVYKHLISIYKLSNKYDLAYEVYKIVLKNYFSDVSLWKNYLEFLFDMENLKMNQNEKISKNKLSTYFITPKEGLNRALQVLNKNKHVDIIVTYGQLQYKFYLIEEARNTFESVLRNYPKRSDIWLVYIDKEIKNKNQTNSIEKIRDIFQKMLTIDFKVKILKTIIKKYLEFEKEFGNTKSIEFVKNLTQKLIFEKMSMINQEKDESEGDMEVEPNN